MNRSDLSIGAAARRVWIALAGLALLVAAIPAAACPFCSAIGRTFAEQMDSFDVVVIATMESEPFSADERQLPRARFRIVDFLRGEEIFSDEALGPDHTFEAIVVSRDHEPNQHFLVMGNGTRFINWSTPMKVSDRVRDYLTQLDTLPEKGPDRLMFFVGHFEDPETVLANDAFDEFARATYDDIRQLADRLDRKQLVKWLTDPDVLDARKRLYYTLLGVCGTEEDVPFLEEIIRSGDPERQRGLDALIACYLTLKGDEGVALVEESFLTNPEAEYIEVFSAIMALRFHGTEADKVSRDRIVKAMRHVLDRPKMADMVIPDLARWEDWTVMDRLVDMFKSADEDTKWLRTPIISYLQACPNPRARGLIEELAEIDPDAVKRAEMLAGLDWESDEGWGDEEGDDTTVPAETTDKDKDDDTGAGGTNGEGQGDGAPRQPANDPPAGDNGDGQDDDAETSRVQGPNIGPPALFVVRGAGTEVDDTQSGDVPDDSLAGNLDDLRFVSTAGGNLPGDQLAGPAPGNSGRTAANIPVSHARPLVPEAISAPVLVASTIGICALLFVLLGSVLNGWFERLLF